MRYQLQSMNLIWNYVSDTKKYLTDFFELWLKVDPYPFELKEELQKTNGEIKHDTSSPACQLETKKRWKESYPQLQTSIAGV